MNHPSPIGVFAYNRPDHLKLCIEAIRRSQAHLEKPLPLYIYCDAACVHEDREKVEEVRRLALETKEAKVILRDCNHGFKNITEGISALCEEYGRVIVIEDDVIIAPDFLPFMTKALDYYEDKDQVFMISGFMYQNTQPYYPETFFFTLDVYLGMGDLEASMGTF